MRVNYLEKLSEILPFKLAAAAHVEAEPLLHDPAGHCRAEEGLARVVDVGPAAHGDEGAGEVLGEGAGARPEVVLVDDVRRRVQPGPVTAALKAFGKTRSS